MKRYIVGKCRSGKIVTSEPSLDDLESEEEIFDAIVMLDVLAAREFRRSGHTDTVTALAKRIALLHALLDEKSSYDIQMDALGARTSLEVLRHARALLAPEFKD